MNEVLIREATTDADYDQWREIRIAALPHERCPSAAELRDLDKPGRLMLLAEWDGKVVGHGLSDQSNETGRAAVVPRVRPDARRQGIGTALLLALAEHAVAQGYDRAGCTVDDAGSVVFAERFGFAEVSRQVEQVRPIGAEPWPAPPTGYEVVTVAERPDLWPLAYHQVAVTTFPDMDVPSLLNVSEHAWATEWMTDPESMFVAVAGDEVIGVAGLLLDPDKPERAEVAYTGVRREWRGQSVASTLKRTSMAWAAEHGITEIYTWTQHGNANMRRLNEHLGFTYGITSIDVRSPLPLTAPN
ncbi:GNAT family N-acetyltransferase [Kribbella qitaiheensis]|uniref:GNAT family N-acetyltransferase n=1 Tax=Kribbella qitaiheensis TaxID=1544730 RepID=A0A7G6X4S4_9ACTN|nr:GNAT family N-acetyltransferase [Kribbella qitaiheensis]QNE21239.1 GNAT family N-acetyltransferase [Kribbella qitaiheensis]